MSEHSQFEISFVMSQWRCHCGLPLSDYTWNRDIKPKEICEEGFSEYEPDFKEHIFIVCQAFHEMSFSIDRYSSIKSTLKRG
jgi:hypothetical protein